MEMRTLGKTGLKVSRLGLGTMTWGRDTDEHEAANQLRIFLDAGGSFIDTAAVYGDGDSERVIGGFIGTLVSRDEITIATKAGISFNQGERAKTKFWGVRFAYQYCARFFNPLDHQSIRFRDEIFVDWGPLGCFDACSR